MVFFYYHINVFITMLSGSQNTGSRESRYVSGISLLWTSLFTTSGSRKLKIQTNNLNKQTNTMYSIQTKDNNK